jgi:LysM repeat protein
VEPINFINVLLTSFEANVAPPHNMNAYICHDLKTLLWKYLAVPLVLSSAFSQAQVDSAIELLADTSSWNITDAHIGGATIDEELEPSLFTEESSTFYLETIADSLFHIPAFDLYCGFDTKNLFAEHNALENVGQGQKFMLCRTDCDFEYPTEGDITSPFGPRWGRMHYGLDIDLETGDNVKAAFEGMVRISQYHASYGNVIVVRHNNGLETLYAHLSKRNVKPGDHVEAGDLIGLGGNTGRSTGSHLHFEIRFMGEAIDPNLVMDPTKKSLRDWELVLDKKHFDYASIDPRVIEARKGTKSVQKKFHTVRKGDTLSAIARKNATTVTALCKLNKVKKSSSLQLGQKIRVR